MDAASGEALDRAAYFLRLSRSEIVQRLAHLADGAVFWGVQLLPADADPETLRRAAKRACDEWGLFVFGDEPLWTGKLPPEPLRVIRGGADDEAAALVLDPAPGDAA